MEALQKADVTVDKHKAPEPAHATMQSALKGACYVVPVLSLSYAESPWCLDELVLMMATPEKVLPVFFGATLDLPTSYFTYFSDTYLSQSPLVARLTRYAVPDPFNTCSILYSTNWMQNAMLYHSAPVTFASISCRVHTSSPEKVKAWSGALMQVRMNTGWIADHYDGASRCGLLAYHA